STLSPDFLATSEFGTGVGGAFVTKLTPTGGLVYSAIVHGASGYGIVVDQDRNAAIAGVKGNGFPVLTPFAAYGESFLAKLNPSGSGLLFSSPLGGSDKDKIDRARGIAVDPLGNIYITGYTNSPDFYTYRPLYPAFRGGEYDVFVTKLTGAGLPIYSTYLG